MRGQYVSRNTPALITATLAAAPLHQASPPSKSALTSPALSETPDATNACLSVLFPTRVDARGSPYQQE